jgi:hypothetical protein
LDRFAEQGETRGKNLILLIQSWDEGAHLAHGFVPMTNWDLRGYSRVVGAGKECRTNRKFGFFILFYPVLFLPRGNSEGIHRV